MESFVTAELQKRANRLGVSGAPLQRAIDTGLLALEEGHDPDAAVDFGRAVLLRAAPLASV